MTRTNHFKVLAAVLALALATSLLALAGQLAQAQTSGDRPQNAECTGALTGTFSHIVVPEGESCSLSGSVVRGHVKAEEDSELYATNNTIGGNIQGDEADVVSIYGRNVVDGNIHARGGDDFVAICGATLKGNIQVQKFEQSRGIIVGGDADFQEGCAPYGGGNTLNKGSVQVKDNVIGPSGLEVSNNQANNLQVSKNEGPNTKIVQNNVVNNLLCKDNDPPFVGQPNEARNANGQCDTTASTMRMNAAAAASSELSSSSAEEGTPDESIPAGPRP